MDNGEYTNYLEEENRRLKTRVEDLEQIIEVQKKGIYYAGAGAAAIVLGPSLSTAIKDYLDSRTSDKEISNEVLANLIAAIVKRIFYVGIVGVTLALLPVAMLFWQNVELRNQSQQLASQLSAQYEYELNRTIFDSGTPKDEAVKQFLELRKHREVNFAGADLSSVVFKEMDFHNVYLRGAIIAHATFKDSKLDNMDFSGNSAAFTSFEGSSLRNAIFKRTILIEATFENADLQNANFDMADISGVNFTGANLKDTTFQDTCFHFPPIWPDGFDIKQHSFSETCKNNVE